MKHIFQQLLVNVLTLSLILGPASPAFSLIAAGDTIDTHKNAEPPFLSYGVKSNLLMVLDNSGSMWDMAYVSNSQPTTIATVDITTVAGVITGIVLHDGGEGYTNGDSLVIAGGNGDATVTVTVTPDVDADGDGDCADAGDTDWNSDGVCDTTSITAVTLDNAGTGYADGEEALVAVDEGRCLDEDYISATPYAGYFDADVWYSYDTANNKFLLDATAKCTVGGALGTKYENSDVCVIIDTVAVNGNPDTIPNDPDDPFDDFEVTAFAARGNLLNWATSSKFDIQKQILTGGKYDNFGDNDTSTGQLVLENRGCSGRRFIKEIDLVDAATTNPYTLSLAIRPPETDEKADLLDDTTRIEIFNISAPGGLDTAACELALEEIQGDDFNPGDKGLISACVWGPNGSPKNTLITASNAAYNNSIQFCWTLGRLLDGEIPNINKEVSEMHTACKGIYDAGIPPSTLTPTDSGFPCYGLYDSTASAPYDPAVQGYLGRCWELAPIFGNCRPLSCDDPDHDGNATNDTDILPQPPGDPSKTNPYHDPFCGADGFVYDCDGNFNADKGTCAGGNFVLQDNEDADCALAPPFIPDWIPTLEPTTLNVVPAGDVDCAFNALVDYCGILDMPDVIDPTDLFSLDQNSDFVSMPAILIESAALSQLGDPIIVMTGRIDVATPPTGLLQIKKDNIRMGAMVFNEFGSASECATNDKINCPAINMDGGYVMTNIATNDAADAHNNDLVSKINNIKADTWTPVTETMYNAIGYYSQDTNLRLNPTDFDTTLGNPIETWCQPNNVLIISEGASTTDLNSDIETFLATITDDSDADPASCGALSGSSRLDDLAFYAQDGLFGDQDESLAVPNNRNIKTYVVVSGSLRVTGTDECSPDVLLENTATNGGTTLYRGENPDALRDALTAIFDDLTERASSGSAASVISSARGGEGAIYQAIFWPELKRTDAFDNEYTVNWAGDVHSLFVDAAGNLYEDSNGNRALDSNGDDNRVVIFYDEVAGISKGRVYDGDNATYTDKDLEEIKFVWSAGEWLASLNADAGETEFNRSTIDSYISNTPARQIFTWNDLDNDGIVDYTSNAATNEVIDFIEGVFGSGDIDTDATKTVAATRGKVGYDFIKRDSGAETYEDNVNNIIGWIRGKDDNGTMRSRLTVDPDDNTNTTIWRLGDIIHSTPMVVSAPAEGYHLIYSDLSFADFYNKYQKRRQVVYFGANDGMLHAVNGGFFSSADNKFYLGDNGTALTDTPPAGESYPALGSELWAYIPYNILPHLSSLTKPEYGNRHKYYVDLRPRIFDAKIFTEEGECRDGLNNPTFSDPLCYHPHGWGTILVGGMRLGGAPIDAAVDMGQPSSVWPFYDNRQFISSYFILDITNPEKPPVLLGETTQTLTDTAFDGDLIPDAPEYVDLGYSTAISTMIIMKTFGSTPATRSNQVTNDWYLVLGSGPHGDDAMKWVSDQNAKVATINLTSINSTATSGTSDLVDSTNYPTKSLRIQKDAPSSGAASNHNKLNGTFELTDSPNGIVSDLITIDYDINPSVYNYKADVVYFGTIEGDFNAAETAWDGNGTFYRLVSRELLGLDEHSTYGTGSTTPPDTYPYDWKIKPVIDLPGQPVSGAASVGTDGHNFWLYFGTGRFGDAIDKSDNATQSFYGIKEPMKWQSTNTATFSWGKLPPLSDPVVVDDTKDPGEKGLLRVDKIGVTYRQVSSTSPLFCRDWVSGAWENVTASSGDTSCLPAPLIDGAGNPKVFNYLIDYTSGDNATDFDNHYCNEAQGYKSCVDGWYKNFQPEGNRERNLGQATLFGGLLTYTTYQPFEDTCRAEGLAYLYANYYQTGTAWYRPVFGYDQYSTEEGVYEKLVLGRGLALTPNLHTGSESGDPKVFIQTSTGEIRELTQTNLPHSQKEGRYKWKEGCN